MVGTIARMFLYSKAPKAAFAVLHPRQTARVATLRWVFRHSKAPRLAAVGAAMMALPLGYALGRVRRGSGGSAAHHA